MEFLMTLLTLTPPAALPVTLTQVKQHLRIDNSEEDDYLVTISQSATIFVEAHIRQKLIQRTMRQFTSELDENASLEFATWPIIQVLKVTAFDEMGNEHVLDPKDYQLMKSRHKASLRFNGLIQPGLLQNGLEIDFIAGIGNSNLDIPADITRAILTLVSHWYEFRGATPSAYEMGTVPGGVYELLAPSRRICL